MVVVRSYFSLTVSVCDTKDDDDDNNKHPSLHKKMPFRRKIVGRSWSSDDAAATDLLSWHHEIAAAITTNKWDPLRRLLERTRDTQQCQQRKRKNRDHRDHPNGNSSSEDIASNKSSLWSRIRQTGRNNNNNNLARKASIRNIHNNDNNINNMNNDPTGLLRLDDEYRTPLHLMLSIRANFYHPPNDLIILMLQCEPRQATVQSNRGRLPLHYAVVFRHDTSTIVQALVDVYPAAISVSDIRQQTPLQYAMDIAKSSMREITNTTIANDNTKNCEELLLDDEIDLELGLPPPRTYWAPPSSLEDSSTIVRWQHQQAEIWSTVHWLLLASATHAQTCLSIGGKKPMLTQALLNAAPPAVISLLISASVPLLATLDGTKASAFCVTAWYTCLARHYPRSILQNLAQQCPTDAAHVRDETGMGLVSAHFLSGCFQKQDPQQHQQQEWIVVEGFVNLLQQCIGMGQLDCQNDMLVEWWSKMEFLISYCSKEPIQESSRSTPSNMSALDVNGDVDYSRRQNFLLHAALTNTDVPPMAIRMLLALYPKSICLPDPVTKALPLHLACMYSDYIPRNYEQLTLGPPESVLEIILTSDPNAVRRRHHRRLPLHWAIVGGRHNDSLELLLRSFRETYTDHSTAVREEESLLQRDPETGLFPFQLAAVFGIATDATTEFRWSWKARNKYSNAVWQGLSEKQKALAIEKTAEHEHLSQLDTTYRLLRRKPSAIEGTRRLSKESLTLVRVPRLRDAPVKSKLEVEEKACAPTVDSILSHYIDWSFTSRKTVAGDRIYTANRENQDLFKQAILSYQTSGKFCSRSDSFDAWWNQMKECIQYTCQTQGVPYFAKHMLLFDHPLRIPNREEFLLHAALANQETHPLIIELILATNSQAASLYLPGTFVLPLHIAAGTPSYIPLSYDEDRICTLALVLRAHPGAVRVACNGCLPLHLAAASGKPLAEIKLFVEVESQLLTKKDPRTRLYPFQLMALQRLTDGVEENLLERKASNRLGGQYWKDLKPERRSYLVNIARKEKELDHLSSVFFMLRRDPSPFNCFANIVIDRDYDSDLVSKHSASRLSFCKSNSCYDSLNYDSTLNRSMASLVECMSDTDGESATSTDSDAIYDHRRTSLMMLLSQTRPREHSDDVYECDSSVFSTVDIMSSLNSTINTSKREDRTISSGAFSDNEDSYSFANTLGESCYDEFAEDSYGKGSLQSKEKEAPLDNEESLVSFEIRRTPRLSVTVALTEIDDEGYSDVNSSLVPSKSNYNPVLNPRERSISAGSISVSSGKSGGSSAMHSEPSRFSFVALRNTETDRLKLAKEMMWMSPELLCPRILTESSQREEDDLSNAQCDHSKSKIASSSSHNSTKSSQKRKPSLATSERTSLLGNDSSVNDDDADDALLNISHDICLSRGSSEPRRLGKQRSDHKSNNRNARLPPNSFHTAVSDRAPALEGMNFLEMGQHREIHPIHSTINGHFNDLGNTPQLDSIALQTGRTFDDSSWTKGTIGYDKGIHGQLDLVGESLESDDKVNTTTDVIKDVEPVVTVTKPCFFDKAAFKWTFDPLESDEIPAESSSSSESPTTVQKPEMTFDKYTMRWVAANECLEMNAFESGTCKSSKIESMTPNGIANQTTRTDRKGPRKPGKREKGHPIGMKELNSNRLTCLMCNENSREVLMIPCRHLCICRRCASKETNLVNCPLCDGFVFDRMVIF